MKTIASHSRKDQIVINEDIDHYADKFFEQVKERLVKSYVFHNKVEGNQLKFKGSIFRFVWNGWDVFNSVSHGQIDFYEENGAPYIQHKINFTEALVIALLFHIIPLFTMKFEPGLSLLVFILIWVLYIINYLVAVFRFNSYISNTLIEVNKTAGYEFDTEEDEKMEDEEAFA